MAASLQRNDILGLNAHQIGSLHGPTAWHALGVDEAIEQLGSSPEGLTQAEADRRQAEWGANRLAEGPSLSLLKILLAQFVSPFIALLILAALISVWLGDTADAFFIAIVLILNAALGAVQEWQAERQSRALRKLVPHTAMALRDGAKRRLPSESLVPGDCVLIESGDHVPADVRLIESHDLRVNESLLTGESLPVAKDAAAGIVANAAISDRATMAFAGTTTLAGRAIALVVETGARTQAGRIAKSLATPSPPTPLMLKMRSFSRGLGLVTLGVIAFIWGIEAARGADMAEMLILAVALAVSAIPEGLPVAMTVSLSVSVRRMAARRALVRALPAVEGLGACTLIASDKTGTLTKNELAVTSFWRPGMATPQPINASPNDGGGPLLKAAMLCNEASYGIDDAGVLRILGDTVDAAFLSAGRSLGLDRAAMIQAEPEAARIFYEPEHRFAASFHYRDGRLIVYVKGAYETVRAFCAIENEAATEAAIEAMAQSGERVLAVAMGYVDDPGHGSLRGLVFLGLAGLMDPPREEARAAVESCRAAGITVAMVTGDHPTTALAIAYRLGLVDHGDAVMTGPQLAALDNAALMAALPGHTVFARIEPLQKLRLVEAWKRLGHFVAVTGDGVNDAPALRAAHVGVAMGRSGSDIARDAADVILTDDNFASLAAGIEEGRIAYANIRKVIYLALVTGAAEVLLFLFSSLAGLPPPLAPAQLLWLNLVTNGIQDVALAFEAGEKDGMRRKPRSPQEPILDRLMTVQVLIAGGWIAAMAFAYYALALAMGETQEEARSDLLWLLVLFENAFVFACRSERLSAFRMPFRNNPLLILSVLAAQGVHIAAAYIPGLGPVLDLQPLHLIDWVLLMVLGLTILPVTEAYKIWLLPRLEQACAIDPKPARA